MNPTPSSSHIYSTRTLVAILFQFIYVSPLPPITGKIPERINCSTLVFSSFLTNCLCFCTILVVPSLSALFVPTYTNKDSPWPCPIELSTRSVTCSTLAPGRQTTIYFPLLMYLSQNGVAHKYPFCSQCPLNHCPRVAPPFPLPLFLLFLSYLSSSLLLTSVSTSLLPIISPLVACTFLLSCPIVTISFSTVTFSPVTFLYVLLSVVLSPFVFLVITLPSHSLLSSYFLSTHCSFGPLYLSSRSFPSISLVILISIPFAVSVSLAVHAVRQSTFQRPKHWEVNPSSIVSAQDFPHPDTTNPPSCSNGHKHSEGRPLCDTVCGILLDRITSVVFVVLFSV